MPWHAKPGCPEHHRAAVERMVNALPPSYLLPPSSGEVFATIDDCTSRLRGYALAEGFDVVKHGGGTRKIPGSRYRCLFHGSNTQNHRKLEDHVEKDPEGRITSKRQRDATSVRQLQCTWSAICSFKIIGKRSVGERGFVLTVQCDTHEGHQLVDDPFVFPAHLKSSEEFQEALRQAKKHREQVLPYSVSRRLIDAEEFGVMLSSRDYYNTVRKEMPDKAKPKTIIALLRVLEDQQFVYQTRFEVEVDKITGKTVARKLVQLFFAHRAQLDAAARFVADWSIVIDGTFNTNELRLPLLVCVGVLSTNRTFPVAFSYCPSESAESIGFVWESLKAECFTPGIAPPRVIIGDWAPGLIKSVAEHWPNARYQGCDWHAVGAMLKFYRGKKKDYNSEEIDGSGEKLQQDQTKADLRVPGLHHFSWIYIQSTTFAALEVNRATLIALLRPRDRYYIDVHWRKVEEAVIYCYTQGYANLGSTSSQRGESYHPVIRKITNGQLSFEESGKRLATTVLSLLKDLSTFEYESMRGYDRRVQVDLSAFQYLVCSISNFALKKIEVEWRSVSTVEAETLGRLPLSTLLVSTNKIDVQQMERAVASSFIAGVFLAGIFYPVSIDLGNLYRDHSSTRVIGCKVRPSSTVIGSHSTQMKSRTRIANLRR
jgi:MULE transposase domain